VSDLRVRAAAAGDIVRLRRLIGAFGAAPQFHRLGANGCDTHVLR
jgi:hypothetical protein